jgi:hypothetical protein
MSDDTGVRWIHAAKPTILVETYLDRSRVTLIGDHGRIAARQIVPAAELHQVLKAAIDAFDFALPGRSFALLTSAVGALEPAPPPPPVLVMDKKTDPPVVRGPGTVTPGGGGPIGGFPPWWITLTCTQLHANIALLGEALHEVTGETADVTAQLRA